MIKLTVVSVVRKTSLEVSTIKFTYPDTKSEDKSESEPTTTRTDGAEWEEIEFSIQREEKPTIQIANVVGNALLVGAMKLVVNNPELFGTYKIGDVIELTPIRVLNSKSN